MSLSLFRIDIFSRQPYVLKDFYEQSLELKLEYASADGASFEFGIGSMKLVISKSVTEVKNKIRICFCTPELKPYRVSLIQRNIEVTPIKVQEGRFFFEMKDPDGNEVAFYQV